MAVCKSSTESRQKRSILTTAIVVVLALLLSGACFSAAQAQPGSERGGRGNRGGRGGGEGRSGFDFRNLTPEQRQKMREAREKYMRSRGQGQPSAEKPAEKPDEKQEKSKAEDDKKDKDEDKTEESEAEKAETIKRPDKPQGEPDRDEFKAKPDEQGFVQFSFQGQKWQDVLQWYADVAGLSFDWQELPDGFLNLTTQRKYRLDETRDLLNRHLLARGFTMIVSGEMMSVVKVKDLDPSFIPRVDADELEDYLPHDFVRVRFQLPKTMEPEQAAKDVKILTSPNAKIQPLLSTKRLHVIDTVANLRNVRDLIYAEQSAITEDVRPRQFMIEYRRADYVADQVMIILGLDPAARKTPQELQIEQQRMQLYTQMAQQKKDVTKLLKPDGPKVHIAVNQSRNSILVNADPAEMQMIERTIKEIDVPADGGKAVARGDLEFKKYQTETVSTDSIITALKEIGGLHPLTQLQSDSRSHTIFATATPDDHKKIADLIDKLDGDVRTGHVIWLNRRVLADQVAGTIQALMVGEDDDKNRRNPFSYYRSRYGGNDDEEEDKMRIQADIENNRLLLWATAEEYKEVETLLKEIGALTSPNSGGNPAKVRVFEARSGEETAKLLQQLQETWSGKNPIDIQRLLKQPSASDQQPTAGQAENGDQPQKDSAEENRDKVTDARRKIPASFVQLRREASTEEPPAEIAAASAKNSSEEANATENAQPAAPPIRITVTPDGRLLATSEDVDALDRLESLLEELTPPTADFKLYRLQNSRASLVVMNLEDYFADELAEDDSPFARFFGRGADSQPATLGKRQKLRFIWDIDTNSIMVQNASAAQLAIIDKLIKIYDQPLEEDSVGARRTEAVQIKYSNAEDIAASVKEVFRDLLSSKDKEFQGKEGQGRSRTETYYRFYDSSNDNKKSAPVKIAFEGPLSIGVDEISNTLIISAQEQIFDTVKALAEQLDEKAKPTTVVRVHRVRTSVPVEKLQEALNEALGQPWTGNSPSGKSSSRRSRR